MADNTGQPTTPTPAPEPPPAVPQPTPGPQSEPPQPIPEGPQSIEPLPAPSEPQPQEPMPPAQPELPAVSQIPPPSAETPQPTPAAPAPPPVQTAQLPSEPVRPHPRSLLAKALEKIRFRKRAKFEKIMAYAAKKRSVTNDDVEKLLRVSDATATRYCAELVRQGRLKRSGATKGTRFEPR